MCETARAGAIQKKGAKKESLFRQKAFFSPLLSDYFLLLLLIYFFSVS
jgi:predicted membrane protein